MCQKCTRAGNYPLVNDLVYWAELHKGTVRVAVSHVQIVIERREVVRVDTTAQGWPPDRRFVAFRDIAHDEQAAVGQLLTRVTDALVEAEKRQDIVSAKMDELNTRGGVSNV